jgi:hypothetical protein
MADSSSLFDTLAGAFGHGVDRPALNAFVANSQATNGLRTAQTDEALNNAQMQQEEMQAHSDLENSLSSVTGDDGKPLLQPSAAHLVANELKGHFGNAQNVMQALREAQQVHNTGVLSNPNNLNTPADTAAIVGNTNKAPEAVAIPNEYAVPAGMTPPVVHQTPLGAAQSAQDLANANLRTNKANAPQTSLSDDAAYNAAVKYNQFGAMPPLGMGASGDRQKILQFAAFMSHDPNWHPPSWDSPQPGATGAAGAAAAAPGATAPGGAASGNPTGSTAHPTLQDATNAAANPTDAKAQQATLTDMTKRTSVADASEQTALKNLGIAREMLQKADQTGSPLANTIVNKVRSGMFGDPDVSAYQNAISTARNEYARVISMATGAQGITDHAMAEGQKLFPDDLAPAQFETNFAVAQREMANRTGSMHDQIANTKRGLHTSPLPTAPTVGSGGGSTSAVAPILLDQYLKSKGY